MVKKLQHATEAPETIILENMYGSRKTKNWNTRFSGKEHTYKAFGLSRLSIVVKNRPTDPNKSKIDVVQDR